MYLTRSFLFFLHYILHDNTSFKSLRVSIKKRREKKESVRSYR